MNRTFDINDTVAALAPLLKKAGFTARPYKTGFLGGPKLNSFGDAAIFERAEKRVEIAVDRSEVYVILRDADPEPIRLDQTCPRISGKFVDMFTAETIKCLKAKLKAWMRPCGSAPPSS